jgi:hypothetical protein
MRSSVTSDSACPHAPTLTDRPNWPQRALGYRPTTGHASAGHSLRYDVAGDDARAGGPVRVRLVDVTRGRRLAADDEGRHVSDDPLAWLDASPGTAAGA